MSILASYVVPHPPLIIPSVGKGEERGIAQTILSYQEIAKRVAALRPQTVVVSSPHAPLYRDGFHVTTDTVLEGSMADFRAPQTKLSVTIDTNLADEIMRISQEQGIPTAASRWRDHEMDHATFIPLYFIDLAYREAGCDPDFKVVRVGLSGLSAQDHRRFGHLIAQAVGKLGRSCVFVASGDLSHKLKADGPYGFAPEGPQLDQRLTELFSANDLDGLFKLDPGFCDKAAECGVRSFQIMAGALEEAGKPGTFASELMSYEGPFGVGYAVAAFERTQESASKDASQDAPDGGSAKDDAPEDPMQVAPDPYVALARESIAYYVQHKSPMPRPRDLPRELTEQRAGVFVSIHKHGALRGCIGTLVPTCGCVADEIIDNGIAACSRDPRFDPVRPDELDALSISVDVLSEAELVFSEDELDPARYGVIVTKGMRRGVLLPNLEGVDTVSEQVAIAKRKAGIRVDDDQVSLERFEVVRHE